MEFNRSKGERQTFLYIEDRSLKNLKEVRELLKEFQKDYPEAVKKAIFYRVNQLTKEIVYQEEKNA